LERQLETLVEMSCLMHDVGNPPFGHFGEAAISHWF
ncbi:HD domain-containing protein, partial [Shewanella indica]